MLKIIFNWDQCKRGLSGDKHISDDGRPRGCVDQILRLLFRSLLATFPFENLGVDQSFVHRSPDMSKPSLFCLKSYCVIVAILLLCLTAGHGQPVPRHGIGIILHGGAGTILKSNMTPELENQYRDTITFALMAGYNVLRNHGSSLDAVEAAIKILEDCPLFNAGKGAVFTHEGTNELDASIMDGNTLKAGAVAAVKHIKNPIMVARMVMERSKHVMLVGDGAEAFAKEQGMSMMPEKYFFTQRRWDELQKAKDAERKQDSLGRLRKEGFPADSSEKHGTVGCVAMDENGNIAAGTSTGGITNKRFGRVGDSPIIGAGTYADNSTCGVSATGDGEYFIRAGVARIISALMEFKNLSVQQAADMAIERVGKLGGTGGVIALDKDGHLGISFNTSGMYRAYIDENGNPVVKIYKE
jgi:beta-aspartyl-peptidase (threonine type)